MRITPIFSSDAQQKDEYILQMIELHVPFFNYLGPGGDQWGTKTDIFQPKKTFNSFCCLSGQTLSSVSLRVWFSAQYQKCLLLLTFGVSTGFACYNPKINKLFPNAQFFVVLRNPFSAAAGRVRRSPSPTMIIFLPSQWFHPTPGTKDTCIIWEMMTSPRVCLRPVSRFQLCP